MSAVESSDSKHEAMELQSTSPDDERRSFLVEFSALFPRVTSKVWMAIAFPFAALAVLLVVAVVATRVAYVVETVPLIIDTDMSFDVDDVGALCMAHTLHDLGEAKLLAVIHDAGVESGVGAASVLNHFYKHDNVLLGAYKGPFGRNKEGRWVFGNYVPELVDKWESPIKSSHEVPDAVALYRRVLADASDHSVAIAAIGFATNIAMLLRSTPDEISPLSGHELVAQKVRLVAWQGGWFPRRHKELPKPGQTFNWDCGEGWYETRPYVGEASYAISNMPDNVEQIFSEVGGEVYTGEGPELQQLATIS